MMELSAAQKTLHFLIGLTLFLPFIYESVFVLVTPVNRMQMVYGEINLEEISL